MGLQPITLSKIYFTLFLSPHYNCLPLFSSKLLLEEIPSHYFSPFLTNHFYCNRKLKTERAGVGPQIYILIRDVYGPPFTELPESFDPSMDPLV